MITLGGPLKREGTANVEEALELSTRWVAFYAWGHENVRATHRSTFEVTRDDYLTPRGDCIIGIKSPIAAAHLPEWFKEAARSEESIIVAVLCAGGVCDAVAGRGSEGLTFTDERRMVFRRSTYVSGDTVMIRASRAAAQLRRDLVDALKRGERLTVMLTVLRAPRPRR